MTDKEYLQRAVTLAKQSAEPVPCACVLVQNGHIISEEYNSQRADEVAVHHAEVKAVYQANRALGSRKLTGVTAYCSCEPCVMCLSALSLARVERIVYGQTMKEVAPEDPMAQIDAARFAEQYLNFTPRLERINLNEGVR